MGAGAPGAVTLPPADKQLIEEFYANPPWDAAAAALTQEETANWYRAGGGSGGGFITIGGKKMLSRAAMAAATTATAAATGCAPQKKGTDTANPSGKTPGNKQNWTVFGGMGLQPGGGSVDVR